MLRRVKEKLGESRYVGDLLTKADRLNGGCKRILFLTGGVLSLFIKHRFNLFDYEDEVRAVRNNNYRYKFHRCNIEFEFFLPHYEEDYIQRQIVNYANFYDNRQLYYLRKNVITRNAVILDIGANIGNHTVFFGKVCRAKRIYCFEPVAETYETLCKNIELNGLENVVVANNVALGSVSGKAKIKFFDSKQIGSTQVEETSDGDLSMARLDDYTFDRIDFIKIDVERYEFNLLKGARETLVKHSPIIFIEIFDDCFQDVNAVLEEYHYRKQETVAPYNYVYRKEC